MARGLMEAHEKGIVNRDVKLENMIVAKDERTEEINTLKLIDWGLS
jgi:serine/threonine protein kinase